MENQLNTKNIDVTEALKELQYIREMVDRGRMIHPIRKLIRPLMPLSVFAGLSIFIYGAVAQNILESSANIIVGMPKFKFLWILGIAVSAVIVLAKSIIPIFKYREDERELIRALKKTYTADYLRVVLPIITLTAAACVVAVQSGNQKQILGLISAGIGSVWSIAPILFPYPELKPVGLIGPIMVVAGIVAMFSFPFYPFYKLAIIWGGGLFMIGILSIRVSKRVQES